MEILLVTLGALVLVLGYTTYNLLRKNEKQEDVLAQYLSYMDKISKQIEYSDVKLNQIDAKGIFKSDDEIGWFFEQIKNLQAQLNNFKLLDDGRSKK